MDKHFHDIIFNNKSLADFGVHCTGSKVFDSPEKDYEMVEIPGRNGDLHIYNGRFKNVDITYKAFTAGDDWGYPNQIDRERLNGGLGFSERMRRLRAWLLYPNGYARLEDTYHPDEYRKAAFKGQLTTEALFLQAGEFDLTFNCMPQRFLKSGEKTFTYTSNEYYTQSKTITNPSLYDAKPFIRVYGKGPLTIGDVIIRIDSSYTHSYIDIDCDIQDAYYGTENCNKYINLVDGEFFSLKPDENKITLGAGISKVDIVPNWWTV